MVKKLHLPVPFFALFILFFCPKSVLAQCAGNDNVMLTVCDIANTSSKTIDLFSQLGGNPTLGGTWRDDDKSGGLNKITGVLNAQQILKSGIYHYTYTVTNVSGCVDNTATVTVTIGGYTGVPAPNSSICSSETSYNLFQVFNGNFPDPQISGTWTDNDGSGGLSPTTGVLNASVAIPDDTYSYTYTIPAIGSCVAPPPSTIYVSIYRSPKPGIPTNLQLCSNQLASYTNLDLNSQLADEDADGIWTEFGTSEINNDTDSFINIQNIYNTRGPGIYAFTYTVKSNNTVCKDLSSTVSITIEKQLDFTGATLTVNSDKCENEIPTATYNAILTQGTQTIPNGSYEVTYSISGIAAPIKTTQFFSGGVLNFPIPSVNFQQVQDYTISIINIKDVNSLGLCNNIIGTIEDVLHIYPIPKINSATLTIAPICQTFDAQVDFSGTSNLTDGSYNIIYNISGGNTATAINAVLNISSGLGTFTIPKNLIPNAGTSTVTITKITNAITGCTNTAALSKSFTINPLPDATNLTATIKNICQGQTANVKLSGLGTLTSISIDYILSGANVSGLQTILLTVTGGEANFIIPINNLQNVGLTSFTITNLANTITGCSSAINNKTDFTVNPIPSIPVANDQKFCTSDNAKVSNLIPQGSQYQWFDSATSTVPLSNTTPLISGNYFVKEVNTTTGCESPLKTITVIINSTPQINNATLAIASICQGYSANVNFSGTSNLTDGNYNILYNLSGNNIATAIPATLNITAGQATFAIAPNLIPNSGNTTITITNITNNLTLCTNTSTLSKSFAVNAIPDTSNMAVTVNNVCLGQAASVTITGLRTLTNVSLTYAVSGANTIASQTIPLVVSNGNTNFSIPATNLQNTGINTLVLTNIMNVGNGCSSVINSLSKNFTVNAIPNSPTASNQKFCETDLATVANLVPNGNQYKWYDTATSTTPLPANKPLTTKNYFVKESNASGCESLATTISVQINTVPIPVLKSNGNQFCGINKPTIFNLSNNTTASSNLTWFDTQSNGTALPNTHLLEEGVTYYGFDYDTTTKCYSSPLSTIVTLTNCSVTPEGLKIPDGFSPNGDGVNDTFQITDIEFSFPNYTLEIFNRYGNVMFKGDNNKPAWDGKNSNSSFISGDAPTGVYFYIINYNKDNLPPKQGQLYLNR
ncbi:gliding motility-associated C-terminal domain-containing protein [Flavobacterium gilvum]|uniref:Ig-like domain-containing protein n=1 Tax=Flavobacterium gilvum TaxID=1492737 RepID=A0AAC9N7C4_9FLAO|nr:gliding motility-associated C-terminal domain-containing protein [Flavobacterium gilvum]AOW10183.1 hypothetical protein EM308_12075 [Flavobacterium gilvum]KFC58566.1 hypothetical protein FEM08_26560 [Flavobacterium gilvum]